MERKPGYTPVENERGLGSYKLVLREGDHVTEMTVPAIALDSTKSVPEGEQEYFNDQMQAGKAVMAFRVGPRGMCAVMVNPEVVSVETMNRYIRQTRYDPEKQKFVDALEALGTPPVRFYSLQLIDAGPPGFEPRIEVEGKTKSNLPFKAVIAYTAL